MEGKLLLPLEHSVGDDAPREFGIVFVGLFLAALVFQRFVPAT